MRFPKFAIENHQFSIIVILLLALMGVVSFMTMPRSEDPQVSPAGSNVVVLLPGANPKDLEELIAEPIEEVINELEDIKEIKTSMEDGLFVLQVEFVSGSDPDDKYSDVVQKVNSVRPQLPDEIVLLETQKWSVSDVRILQLALVGEKVEYSVLEKQADIIKKDFEKVAGVKKVKMLAYPEQEVRIALDMERIASMNISLNSIFNAIVSNNANIPGGSIEVGDKKLNIQTSGSFEELREISNTIVDARDGKIVYLKDVAQVFFNYEDDKHIARFNGEKSVFIAVSQKEGTNIFNIFDGLNEKIEKAEKRLPEGIRLERVFDQSESVSKRLNGFFLNLFQGLILVGLVVLLAVGFRASGVVILAIPLSILIGVAFVDFSGFGLEQMSIAGLVIALGLLVDNAIVVTENISRFTEMGYSPVEAAIKGTAQIGWAVTSSTATTVLAFVPIIMIQNITGDFIRSMPATVVYTLTASLLVSLMLTPYLSSKFICVKKVREGKPSKLRTLLSSFIEKHYRTILSWTLDRPKTVFAVAIMVFLMSLSLFPLVGVSFFPKAEKSQILINIELPEGTSITKTDNVARDVEKILDNDEDVKVYATNVGKGNPRVYYNIIPKHEKSNTGQIFVDLKEMNASEFAKKLEYYRAELKDFAGVRLEVKEFEQGPPIEAPIAIRVIGENLDVIKNISRDIENIFKQTEGTININNPLATSKTDLHVKINRAKAGMLGVPVHEIDRTIRTAITGIAVSKFRDANGKEYDIVVRLPIEEKPELSDFDKIYVSSVLGAQIPLKQLASIEFKAGPVVIDHYNLERNNIITADVIGNLSVNNISNEIIEKLEEYDFPAGYRYYVAGEKESQQESFGGMLQAVLIAVIGIFGVLVLQFRSYSQPLIVFVAIPLAIIGSVLALLVTGYSFSFTAFIGLTSLVGIVVNNSILLVDYTNQLRSMGEDLLTALKTAGETRFIPIILTTATTIGGLLPLTLGGGSLWAPMGWTIIGGLLVSTILTLVIVPVLYKLFAK